MFHFFLSWYRPFSGIQRQLPPQRLHLCQTPQKTCSSSQRVTRLWSVPVLGQRCLIPWITAWMRRGLCRSWMVPSWGWVQRNISLFQHSPQKCSGHYQVRPVGTMYRSGPWFNMKMSPYQYRISNCGDKTVVRSSYLHNWISYTGQMTSWYWFGPLGPVSI